MDGPRTYQDRDFQAIIGSVMEDRPAWEVLIDEIRRLKSLSHFLHYRRDLVEIFILDVQVGLKLTRVLRTEAGSIPAVGYRRKLMYNTYWSG